MPHRVFISYKSEEHLHAQWVRERLEAAGLSCWMAPESIPGGSNYAIQIPQAIKVCDVFVIILSKRAQVSRWLPKELDQAINAGKVVMPFFIEPCPLREDFSFYLANIQRYEAWKDREGAISKMIRDILMVENKLGAIPERTAAKDIDISTDKRRKRKPEFSALHAAITLVAVIIVAFILVWVSRQGKKTTSGNIASSAKDTASSEADIMIGTEELPEDSLIEWRDSNLEQAVKKYLGISGIMTVKQAAEVKKLKLKSAEISDITALQFFSGLEELYLNDNQISDLSPVSGLRNLYLLNAESNRISDISCLSNMTRLQRIDLCDNQIEEIDGFEKLTHLTVLDIRRNQISNIHSLENLTDIKELYISNNRISDISSIAGMKKLTYLSASYNRIEDISVLSDKTDLTVLVLNNNKITDISVLRNLKKINHLKIRGNQIEDTSPLDEYPETNYLDITLQKY